MVWVLLTVHRALWPVPSFSCDGTVSIDQGNVVLRLFSFFRLGLSAIDEGSSLLVSYKQTRNDRATHIQEIFEFCINLRIVHQRKFQWSLKWLQGSWTLWSGEAQQQLGMSQQLCIHYPAFHPEERLQIVLYKPSPQSIPKIFAHLDIRLKITLPFTVIFSSCIGHPQPTFILVVVTL